MKKLSLFFCLSLMMLFSFSSFATGYGVTISSGLTSDTVCSGTIITFTATPSPGTGSYGYIWNVNGSYAGTSSSTYTTSTLVSGVNKISCLLTNAANDSIYAISDTITITIDTLPVNQPIESATTPAAVCVGDTLNLTDAATGGVWVSGTPADASVSSIGTVTGIAVPAGGGGFGGGPSVRIYYIMTNSCGSDSSRIGVSIAAPASAIGIASTTICIDSSVMIIDSTGGGTWSSSDSTIGSVGFSIGSGFPPSFGETVIGNTAGTITITYTGTNACGTYTETVDVTVINCSTSVANVTTISNSCSIYPNPSTGTFNIVANSDKYTQANCIVANLLGEKVKDFTISTNHEASVNLNIPTGVYFITVSAGEEKYTSKVVIME